MTYLSGLPDPQLHGEFYQDVPAKRLAAFGIDLVLTLVFSLLVVLGTALTGLFFFPLIWMSVGFIYRSVTLARGSATWGMRVMAIELRDAFGQPLTLPLAIMHTLLYSVCIGFVLPQVFSIILALNGARGQLLHDHLLGTAAVNRSARH